MLLSFTLTALLSSTSSNGFQLVVSGAQQKALSDFQIINIQVVYLQLILLLQFCNIIINSVGIIIFIKLTCMMFKKTVIAGGRREIRQFQIIDSFVCHMLYL